MKLKQLAMVLGAVGAMAASGYALAATYYYDYEYYSDGSYTTVVGEKIITCKGRVFTYGTVTPYRRTIESYNCAFPIP